MYEIRGADGIILIDDKASRGQFLCYVESGEIGIDGVMVAALKKAAVQAYLRQFADDGNSFGQF